MSAKDVFHETVKTALIKDGWKITHDPLTLTFGERRAYVDLGAEQPFAAERDNRKIAVEVKSFRGASDLRDYESALGQYIFYRSLLARSEPERKLYLAVPNSAYLTTFTEVIVLPSLEDAAVSVVTFDPTKEVIVKWIN